MSKLKTAKHYWLSIGAVSLFFLVTYLIVEALHVPVLTDPTPLLSHAGVLSAVFGVGLLVVDVLLPVPSSLVMIAHGALFGILHGALLSLVGRAGSLLLGYYLGVKFLPFAKRFIPEREMVTARAMLERWGTLAIILSRPLPILSETVAIMTGVSSLSLKKALPAAIIGSLPEAVLFAVTGELALGFDVTALVFISIILVSGVVWFISRQTERKLTQAAERS